MDEHALEREAARSGNGREGDLIICTTVAELRALATAWDDLDTFLSAPSSRFPWTLACAQTLAEDSRLFVACVRDGDRLAAAAALTRPRRTLGAARQLGVRWLGEPSDFVYRDTGWLDELVGRLAAARVPLLLERTPTDSPLTAAVHRAYGGRGSVVVRPRPDCPYVDITGTEDDVTAALPSRLRGDLRRASRRAAEFGELAVEIHSPSSAADLEPIWERALAVEAAGWKGRGGSALAINRRVGPFFRDYAALASRRGTLRILFLSFGRQPASMMIAVEECRRLWILKIGYDERYGRCSPGQILMHEALRHAARRGLRSCEFLGTAEGWTRRWTDRGRQTQGVFAYPHTVLGAAVLAAGTSRHLFGRLRSRRGAL